MLHSLIDHYTSNILQRRFDLDESDASTKGSYVLAGSVFLYPIVSFVAQSHCQYRVHRHTVQIGLVVDRVKRRNIVMKLFLLSATLTLGCYIWLAFPPQFTKTPIPAIISFATGHGFSPREQHQKATTH